MSANGSSDRPLSAILSDATRELSTLVRQEIELAKLELSREAGKAAAAGGLFGAAGVFGIVAFLLLSAALAMGLAELGMQPSLAALVVAVLYLLIAAGMVLVGRRSIKSFSPAPERTIRTIREDVEWARSRKT
ncbi:MAG: phage holin family protein [Mycobacteriales bacterium]